MAQLMHRLKPAAQVSCLNPQELLERAIQSWLEAPGELEQMPLGEVCTRRMMSTSTMSTWEILRDNSWQADSTAKVTCDGNTDACCSGLSITSTGGIASTYPDLLGTYQQDFAATGEHPVYTKGDIFQLRIRARTSKEF